ncbi:type II toxin-antitoxin system mRNA interferase toxin, RelE/StbE family [Idiomarina abyssalis]|jgi:toxin ParE1/3/4|uniref:type II toxin-antitoxin system RelE/ParE family toxin n=1 Tax=Idiomarina abyssalis TaxID=86102 RepID=UPI0006C8DA96|nr:type II toxin-antitoxin system mRNA interferase toxin, RelE/StbE family [Idiomarina abyssalis]KPD21793.1 plasmid stabilization protein ParE [Idiomarina abyssalis]SFT67830.1 addiction module toxin, RelE/StbE family [Idiomarina abyssalis]
MIYWEEDALKDRERIFEFLYNFNPIVAEQTDSLIQNKVETLLEQPYIGVKRENIKGRLLILPDVSMLVPYYIDGTNIRVLRVLHEKQQFPFT